MSFNDLNRCVFVAFQDELVAVPALREQIEQYRAACLSAITPPGIAGEAGTAGVPTQEVTPPPKHVIPNKRIY